MILVFTLYNIKEEWESHSRPIFICGWYLDDTF